MSTSPTRPRGRFRRSFAVIAISSAILLTGCARTPVAPTADAFGGQAAGELQPSTSPSITTVLPPVTPSPTPTPTVTEKPKPVDPFDALSKKTKKEFKGCFDKAVSPGSSGRCAQLVIKKLKAAKFYPWAMTSRISTVGANAILNYQRSRGIKATGTVARQTWLALATKAKAVPQVLPKKCLAKGVVICVDQAHRKLFWLKNGKVVKTVKVRLGGWNNHPKKPKQWRVYPTANGTWKVYDKQVNPKSDNYGSGAMPYSVMFYPDMYVHYSPGFHSVGYAGSSHGCVNVGNLADAIWIFKHTPIGTKVHVYSLKK